MPRKNGSIDEIQKMLDKGLLVRGNDPSLILQRISSGIADLDRIINGGIARSRISIIAGEFSSGKSFLQQMIIKTALENDMSAVYVDTERSYDPVWWEQVGIASENLLVSQPHTGEEAEDVILESVHSGVDVVAIDSLAALVPMEEAEQEDSKKKFIGLQARLINNLMRRLLATKHNSVIICTNQLRDTIGGPGPVDNMPGGWGQLFFASLILRTRREGWLEEKGERVGFNLKVICRKSKVGRPFGECVLPFHFRGEIDFLGLLVERGIEAGLIKQTGPWFELKFAQQEEKLLGKNTVIGHIKEHEDLKKSLEVALG